MCHKKKIIIEDIMKKLVQFYYIWDGWIIQNQYQRLLTVAMKLVISETTAWLLAIMR